jgi:hypothetical protein
MIGIGSPLASPLSSPPLVSLDASVDSPELSEPLLDSLEDELLEPPQADSTKAAINARAATRTTARPRLGTSPLPKSFEKNPT